MIIKIKIALVYIIGVLVAFIPSFLSSYFLWSFWISIPIAMITGAAVGYSIIKVHLKLRKEQTKKLLMQWEKEDREIWQKRSLY